MGLLNETFGESGVAQTFFGGEWWLVGVLLLLIFALYFYGKGISAEGMILFIFSGILLITIDNLFVIENSILMMVIIFILVYISLLGSKAFTK